MGSPFILIIPAAFFILFVIHMWNEMGPKPVLQGLFVFGVPVVVAVVSGEELALLTIIPCLAVVAAVK